MANYLRWTVPPEHNGDIWYFYTTARALKIDEARERIKKNIEKRRKLRKRKKAPLPEPRYDEVYFKGLKWLETLV